MKLSRRVALGGTELDQVDPSIVIRSIEIGTPKENVQAVSRMGGSGQRITGRHYDTAEVTVEFAIDIPKRRLADRREAFDKVIKWAMNAGWLTVNYMTGKKLYTEVAVLPGGVDIWNWTDGYTITFRAYAVPFWQDATATTSTGASITVPGIAETVCDMEVTNGSGATVDSLTVQVGGSSMSFTGLGLEDGQRLVIGHEDNGTLYIRKYTGASYYVRVMDKRTGGSADDLYVTPGTNAITVSGENMTWSVSCRGRYV